MSAITPEAVDATALVIRQSWQQDATATDITGDDRADARAAIEAALPRIEEQIRQQIAEEIRAEMPPLTTRRSGQTMRACLEHAARIAEGGAPNEPPR